LKRALNLFTAVDGGYCEWSPWQRCNNVTGGCLCRTRSCDCPQPRFGGRQCEAGSPQLQIVNCTGVWSYFYSLTSTSNSFIHSFTHSSLAHVRLQSVDLFLCILRVSQRSWGDAFDFSLKFAEFNIGCCNRLLRESMFVHCFI